MAISTLAIEKKLDAAFACPRLDLTEPMSRGEERLQRKTLSTAFSSSSSHAYTINMDKYTVVSSSLTTFLCLTYVPL
jgi:hypothetical protein